MRIRHGTMKGAILALGIGSCLMSGVIAQQPGGNEPPPELQVFSEVLDVRVVNVEVVVTDRQGVRVNGLSKADFRLLVDGEEVPIDYFTEIVGGQVSASRQADVEAEEVAALPPAVEAGGEVGTSYLIFIDDQFAIQRDRNRVLDKLQEDLGYLGEADRMAIVAFDGRELSMLTSWTNSDRVLENAFREAKDRKAMGLMRLAELRMNDEQRTELSSSIASSVNFAESTGSTSVNRDIFARLEPVEREFAVRLEDQLSRSVTAAVATMRGFASPPGRKVMLVLSGGWPYSPGEFTVASFDTSLETATAAGLDPTVKQGEQLYGELSDTANLLGYTLYPVDLPGFDRDSQLDASLRPGDAVTGAGFPVSPGGPIFPRELNEHTSLSFLAAETGGEVYLNSQRDTAFADVVADTRSYYWLGFSPERKQDDEAHDIQVEVVRKGLDVRYRKGFLDFSPQREATMMVESALFFGSPPSASPLELRFGKPQKAGRNRVNVPLEVKIPMDQVTLIPMQGRYVANLEVRVTVMDENGNRSETPMAPISIAGPEPASPGQVYTYETGLLMRRRPHRVIVAVNDPVSGAMLSSAIEISP